MEELQMNADQDGTENNDDKITTLMTIIISSMGDACYILSLFVFSGA